MTPGARARNVTVDFAISGSHETSENRFTILFCLASHHMDELLRPATEADVPALEVIRRQALEAALSEHFAQSRYADLMVGAHSQLIEWVTDEAYAVHVIDHGPTPASYVALDRECGEIVALYTAPDFQGAGYATDLLAEIEAQFDGEALRALVPTVTVGFFQERGFAERETDASGWIPRSLIRKQLPG